MSERRSGSARPYEQLPSAVLHALALKAFYRFASDTCLEIEAKSAGLGTNAPGLGDTASAKSVDTRHQAWVDRLPAQSEELWDALLGFDDASRQVLFAHCAAHTVNAMHETWNRRPKAMVHADRLAQAVGLDMASIWAPTDANFLGRVTKSRILDAVREAKGEQASQLIDHLKKPEMAKEAERLLAGTGWLPEPLRTPGDELALAAEAEMEAEALPAFLADDGEDPGDVGPELEPEPAALAIAAE